MKDKFKGWSCSFSGCDGGNLNADLWLCGIEWGQGSYGGHYEEELPEEISKGAVENPANTFDR